MRQRASITCVKCSLAMSDTNTDLKIRETGRRRWPAKKKASPSETLTRKRGCGVRDSNGRGLKNHTDKVR
jgi:hypothetical protein